MAHVILGAGEGSQLRALYVESTEDFSAAWEGPRKYRAMHNYAVDDKRHGRKPWIRKGTLSDGASVPRILWPVMAPDELGRVAVFNHDDLYRNGGFAWIKQNGVWVHVQLYTRLEADRLFYDLMILEGVPYWRARAAYLGVRARGAAHWQSTPTGRPAHV
jgi:hypothetical protein